MHEEKFGAEMVRKEKMAFVSHMLYVVFIFHVFTDKVKTNHLAVYIYHLLHLYS